MRKKYNKKERSKTKKNRFLCIKKQIDTENEKRKNKIIEYKREKKKMTKSSNDFFI